MSKLLTEIADYGEPGSWDRMSKGWPEIRGDVAYAMYVFANFAPTVPYGSYTLRRKGKLVLLPANCIRLVVPADDALGREITAMRKSKAKAKAKAKAKEAADRATRKAAREAKRGVRG